MTMAYRLAKCLSDKQSQFDTVRHPDNGDDNAGAKSASVPRDRLARTVLLEDSKGYLAAVIPSTHLLKLDELRAQTGRRLTLARGEGVREVFRDCHPGAIPPVGMAYGTQTWLDDSLLSHSDVYLEAGDHQQLLHMRMEQFAALMVDARRGHFAHRMM